MTIDDLDAYSYSGGQKRIRIEPTKVSSIEDPEAVRPHMFPRMNLNDLPPRTNQSDPKPEKK